jgi:hypothetical protein
MSDEKDKDRTGRLWSAGPTREKPTRPEPPSRPNDNVVQLRHDRPYVAFEVRDHPARIHICCATQPSTYPAYSSLLTILHDPTFDKAFTLVYSFMLAEITGHDLGAIVHAINYGNCERITEYHPKLYERPAANEPIIESVKITAHFGGTERR